MSSGVRGGAWDPEVIDQAIPLLKEPSHNSSYGVPSGEPPVPLKGEDLKVYRGERFAVKDDGSGEIDHSDTLYWIGCGLARAMKNMPLSKETKTSIIAEAAAERDTTLGYHKYSNRRDAEVRYAEIAHKALEDVASQSDLKVVRLSDRKRGSDDEGREDAGEQAPAPDAPDTLPTIQVNDRRLRDITEDAMKALEAGNDPPVLFQRNGRLVRVRRDDKGVAHIEPVEEHHLKHQMERTANYVNIKAKDGETVEIAVPPPKVAVQDVQASLAWPFPAIEAIVEAPIIREDGSILSTPGYDPQTRLYYNPRPGFEFPEVPQDPTDEDTARAKAQIDEAFGEFPYEDESSTANALAYIVTPYVRHFIPGPVPMGLVDKPQAGTGGSLLVEAAAIMATGYAARMQSVPQGDDEMRKAITAALSDGASMIAFDNVEGTLYLPSLSRALTASLWRDRVLGRSEMTTLPQRATWAATGNNVRLGGDMPRRCYWIRLDAKRAQPWQRKGFRHPDLISWITRHRGELVSALLTLVRAWIIAGKPEADVPVLGSFEHWAKTVGSIVKFAGLDGFLGNLDDLYQNADDESTEWVAFFSKWLEEIGAEPATVAEVTKEIKTTSDFKEALPAYLADALDKGDKGDGGFRRKLGRALAARDGRRYLDEDGDREIFVKRAGTSHKVAKWVVQIAPIPGPEEGGPGGLGGLFPSQPRNEKTEKKEGNVNSKGEAHKPPKPPHTSVHPEESPANGGKTRDAAEGGFVSKTPSQEEAVDEKPREKEGGFAKKAGGFDEDQIPVSFDLKSGESSTVRELRERRERRQQQESDPLSAWLSDPPKWFQKQADDCIAEGTPDRLLNALASGVAWEVYQDMGRFAGALTRVRAWVEERQGKEGA